MLCSFVGWCTVPCYGYIGCNVGRVCFELATCFEEVIGIDVSEECLSTANQLRKEGQTPYTVHIEGKIVKEYTALVNPERGL